MSSEHINYLKKINKDKMVVSLIQIIIVISFLFIWEFLVEKEYISSFIYSSPKLIVITIYSLIKDGVFFIHIWTTIKEVLISFTLGITFGFIIALLLYHFNTFAKIIDPFLTILNSLPKVALGPLIIIVFGSNTKSIIIMALLINLITTIITIYNGFLNTNLYHLKLFKSLNASKGQILTKLVIPSSYANIISSCKICVSQTLIGVIMGEFLVSKSGIGYLIVYGKQIFNLNYVMSGIIILAIFSYILYKIVIIIENKLIK